MIKLMFFFLMLFLMGNAWAGLEEKSLEHNGKKRIWWEYAPIACKKRACPLVLAFHGGGGRGDKLEKNIQMQSVAKKNEFVLVYPNALDENWNDGRPEIASGIDDVGFIDALLKVLKAEYQIEESRVYATGISNGALFTFRLACERPDVFAAIAPVAGNMGELLSKTCAPKGTVSILNIVGSEDGIVPFAGGAVTGPLGFKKRGKVLSSDATIGFWTEKAKCQGAPEIAAPLDVSNDGTKVKIEKYQKCQDGIVIHRYIIEGGGHTWPGGSRQLGRLVGKVSEEINASDEIWKFFATHAKKKLSF